MRFWILIFVPLAACTVVGLMWKPVPARDQRLVTASEVVSHQVSANDMATPALQNFMRDEFADKPWAERRAVKDIGQRTVAVFGICVVALLLGLKRQRWLR